MHKVSSIPEKARVVFYRENQTSLLSFLAHSISQCYCVLFFFFLLLPDVVDEAVGVNGRATTVSRELQEAV